MDTDDHGPQGQQKNEEGEMGKRRDEEHNERLVLTPQDVEKLLKDITGGNKVKSQAMLLASKYGEMITCSLFGRPIVVSVDLEFNNGRRSAQTTVNLLTNEKLRRNFMPAIQVEEHETIQKHKGDEKLQWEDYKKMKFTQCYVIPKGWGVMIFFYAVHMNGKFFNDPLKFNPWRWQGKDKEVLWKNYDMLFSPFGGGRRFCPGADLARMSISFFLHYFVTKFRYEGPVQE
ncbi:3-epi-6-deoxocathasterone 23-monooxygenase CYP90D1-like [Cryptomeria japonica]|uniref:3-epi-6-deoxocathasterone 23-monooxygenase CYP90D1-like n=1 Tax=Cryptomeria japonica TaxID=3369 RepID=UPI0027DAA2B4|nr:3-epi-6-deoxocathasterone 23-monooxygenase CYP90D1-like [Cryptomeria japonica]